MLLFPAQALYALQCRPRSANATQWQHYTANQCTPCNFTHPSSTECTVQCTYTEGSCTVAARIVPFAVPRTAYSVPGTYAYCVRIVFSA